LEKRIIQSTKGDSQMNKQIKTGPIMAAFLVAGFVGLFSETALNIALGDLSQIFSVSTTTIQWLATGYYLTLGILVPVTGILMQKFTTRQMFMTAISLTLLGTIISSVAPVFGVLLAGRIIQAAGLAITLPLTQNVIFTIYPPNKRGGAMGLMGLVMLAGPALGPTLSGLILDTLSWHWIFWLTIPFSIFSLVFGLLYLANVNEKRNVSIDVLSVVLSTIGFGGIVYGVGVAGVSGWTSTTVLGSVIIGIAALVVFAIRQTKMENPMLNLKAFKYPLFVLGIFMTFITFFNMLSMLVILPMYMQMALLIAAFTTGLMLLPGSLLNCILAPSIGRLFDKYGPKAVIIPGTILVAVGYAIYSQFGTETALWMIVFTHIVMMLGIGAVLASVQTNTLNSLPKEYYPDGIALTQTLQQVAGAIGIAITVSIYSVAQNHYLGEIANVPTRAASAGAVIVFKIGFLLAVINVVLSLFIEKPKDFEHSAVISTPNQEQLTAKPKIELVPIANQYKSIVVAVDGSKEAEYAFHKSIDTAKRNVDSTLTIVNVVDTRSFEAYDKSIFESAQKSAEVLLNGYKNQAEGSGVENVKVLIEYGSPQNVITKDIAKLVNADLIICGATGLNSVERFLIGSVSESIVRYAKCDVLVIRTPE